MTHPTEEPHDDLVRNNVDWARDVAYDVVRNHAEADDLTQDLWLEVLSKRPQDVRSPRAWIRGAIKNLNLASRRKNSTRNKYESAAAAMSPQTTLPADVEDARDLVRWALSRVRSPFRETLESKYIENLDNAEIARRFEISAETVRTRISRGLSQLRDELRKKGLGEGTPWTVLLLPLLLNPNERSRHSGSLQLERRDEDSAVQTTQVVHSSVKKRMLMGFVGAAALVLILRWPTLFESSPPNAPIIRTTEDTASDETWTKRDREIAAAEEQAKAPANLSTPNPSTAEPKPSPAYGMSIVVNVIESGVIADVPIAIEASPHGPIALAMPARRPVRLTPEEQMPFVTVATGSGRSGQPIMFDVPKNELYYLRITCQSTHNVAYAKLPPGIEGKVTIQLARKLRVRIPGISFDAKVAVRSDRLQANGSMTMRTPDDDDDDVRIATGAFLLPVHLDVDIETLGVTATAELGAADAVLALPPLIKTTCRVRSAADERLVDGLTVRSVVFGSDGTLWSIVTRPTSLGHCEMTTPSLNNVTAPHFVQFRATGYDTTTIDGPAKTRRLREQETSIDPSAPYDIYLAPVGYRGGGSMLDADGLPVSRGAVFLLAEGLSAYGAVVDDQGRFKFEPLMKTTSLLNSKFEYRPGVIAISETVSLLYENDDDSSMVHFDDVPRDALIRGEWLGRLPAGPAPRIRFVDHVTRREIFPSQVVFRPLSRDSRPLGTPLFEKFAFKRTPRRGLWRVDASSEHYKPTVATIDADRDIIEIEMSPEAQTSTTVDVRADDQPVADQEVTFLRVDGSVIGGGALKTDSSGRVFLVGAEPPNNARYRIKHPTHRPSVKSSPLVEVGKPNIIELIETVAVPIHATDLAGKPIAHVVVAACDSSGRRVQDDLLFPERSYVKLTKEPQVLVVLDSAHHPQVVSWAPSPDGGIQPIQVIMRGGHRLTMSLGDVSASDDHYIAGLRLLAPFVDGVSGAVPSPRWTFSPGRDVDDPSILSFDLAPGRYRLEIAHRNEVVCEKVFDVRSGTDLGKVELNH